MFECFSAEGKIRRVGVASVKRVLNNPTNITDEGEDIWASVSCPDAGVYVTRDGKKYIVSWFVGDTVQEVDLTKQKAITRFLELRKREMDKCSE